MSRHSKRRNNTKAVSENEQTMPNMEELLKILTELNQEQNRQILSLMMEYMNEMEKNFSSVLKELDAVKGQLSAYEKDAPKDMRAALSDLPGELQEKISVRQGQLKELKADLNEKAALAVQSFKEHGVSALNHVCEFLGIKEKLLQMRLSLLENAQEMQAAMDRIDKAGREFQKAVSHAKNIGRAMSGKELAEAPEQKEKGLFHMMKQVCLRRKDTCTIKAAKLGKFISGLEQLEKSAEKSKESVISRLQEHKDRQNGQTAAQEEVKAKARTQAAVI